MASFVLQPAGKFPVGTSVSAYKRSNWPGIKQGSISGAPVGSSDATATVASDGSLTLTGLADLTPYVAYASVNSVDTYVGFTTGNPAALGSDQGSPGSAAPAEAEQVAGSDGTNLRVLKTLADGTVVIDSELPAAAAAAGNDANTASPSVRAYLEAFDGSLWQPIRTAFTAGGDGSLMATSPAIAPWVYAPSGGSAVWDRPRTPNVFKSFASTAITAGTGATIWTPAAGRKFRVMGWAISTSVAGVIILGDNAVGTVIARSPALAAAGFFQLGAADMGNGILSAAANNVLKVDGPTGNVAGMVWGVEE